VKVTTTNSTGGLCEDDDSDDANAGDDEVDDGGQKLHKLSSCMLLRSKRRKMFLQKHLNDGNYSHNVEVLRSNMGEIIPPKRPAYSVVHKNFIPCEYGKTMETREDWCI